MIYYECRDITTLHKHMNIDSKELAVVKSQVTKATKAANEIIVDNDEQMLEAGELRKKIKTVGKMIKEKKDSIIKPINEGLKSVKEMFAPVEADCEAADGIISKKMLDYQREQDDKRRKAEREAAEKLAETAKKLEEGKVTEKQAEKEIAKVETKLEKAPEAITKSASFHTRIVRKIKIIDAELIPREYLTADEPKIRQALFAGIEVAGTELIEEKILI